MYTNLYNTPKIYSGKNCVLDNANIFSSYGKRCIIVTSKTGAVKSGALQDVTTALDSQGIEYVVFDKITENPLVSTVIEGGATAREFGADFVVGIGGGSPLDASKAVAICAMNPQYDIDGLYNRKNPSKALPVILVGTTSGTGSEVTGVSVLTNDKTMQKKSIGGADCYGAVAFCDAKYTHSMSYNVTVTTALDAFAHAVEGYFSPKCTEYPRMYAEMALKILFKGLKVLWETKCIPDENTREELYLGSIYAGLELNVCGAAFPHTVGYVLTEEFSIPHGKACTAFMPLFIQKAKREDAEKFHSFLRCVGANEAELVEVVEKLTDVKIEATDEQIEEWCSRWKNGNKNFDNSPGGFDYKQAEEAIKSLR